jgi:hypothetical protein
VWSPASVHPEALEGEYGGDSNNDPKSGCLAERGSPVLVGRSCSCTLRAHALFRSFRSLTVAGKGWGWGVSVSAHDRKKEMEMWVDYQFALPSITVAVLSPPEGQQYLFPPNSDVAVALEKGGRVKCDRRYTSGK